MENNQSQSGIAPPVPPAGDEASALRSLIANHRLSPHFMPIIDAYSGSVLAFEVVIRGEGALTMPADLFPAARRAGLHVELETECRHVVLERLGHLTENFRGRLRFFVNVSSELLMSDEFREGFKQSALNEYGLSADMLVLEITEKDDIVDHDVFERAIRECVREGYRIALDDFGSGHAGLLQLSACLPHFIKLDRKLVEEIDHQTYRQQLVRALGQFATSMDTRFIAEGVETIEQLDTLLRLGIRYVQGFLFGPVSDHPRFPSSDVLQKMNKRAQRHLSARSTQEESVSSLATSGVTIKYGELNCKQVDAMLLDQPHTDHLVVLRNHKPMALVTRQHFYSNMAGPHAFDLHGEKPVERFAKQDPLCMLETAPITRAARVAMTRLLEDVYDPIVVVDALGAYAGTIPMHQLFTRSLDLEVRNALDTNPLTGLPGNRRIEEWIADAWHHEHAMLIYADLDRFKEYNDCYGFLLGDEMIRLAARVMLSALEAVGSVSHRLGHIGGDDFVIVSREKLDYSVLQEICISFDNLKRPLFDPPHQQQNWFPSTDRAGVETEVPLVTLSLAVLPELRIPGKRRLTDLSPRVADLKKLAKQLTKEQGRSGYLVEVVDPDMVTRF